MIASTVVMDTIANMLIGYALDERRSHDKERTADIALEDIRALLELQDDSIREQLEELKL